GAAAQAPVTGNITDTSPGATAQNVAVTGTVNAVTTPTITVTPSTLSLGTTTAGTAGTAATFTVSGSNLTAPIVITAPTGVEISNGGTTFSSTVTLTPTSGTVAATTISARISSAAAQGPITGNITDTSSAVTLHDALPICTVNAVTTPT